LRFARSCLLLVALAVSHHSAAGHDIPTDASVNLFLRAEGERLQLLVRVPLRTIRDIVFPERERGYLDVERLVPLLPDAAALWLGGFVEIYADGSRLAAPNVAATQISLPSDRSFLSFEQALGHVTGPKPSSGANLVWNQVLFDVLFEYRIRSSRSPLAIRPGLHHLAARTRTVLRFVAPGGAVRAFEFEGDPGVFPLDPRWQQAAFRFVRLGFEHIVDGTDHLLFLLCLVIPYRRLRPLVWVVTAFTVAHSMTLFAAAWNLTPQALWFPPLIETLIAASIVFMAFENIVVGGGPPQRRWLFALGFGLVHGFGFSFALRETMQFAGSHLLVSLVAFNLGVELGQLAALIVLVPLLELLFRFVVAERMGTILISALVAHTGCHWMAERFDDLRKFPVRWPELSSAFLASVMRWLFVTAAVAGVVWYLRSRRKSTAAS
jgi:hypothetical protein